MAEMIVDPRGVIDHGLRMLPSRLDTRHARAMMFAIGRQESRFQVRRQAGNGPARGFWQFERGGGVIGVMSHRASRDHAISVCSRASVRFDSGAIWRALESNDDLAVVFARLLLLTDPAPLPVPVAASEQASWDYYYRTWRPGRPHRETWARFWREACAAYQLEDA